MKCMLPIQFTDLKLIMETAFLRNLVFNQTAARLNAQEHCRIRVKSQLRDLEVDEE